MKKKKSNKTRNFDNAQYKWLRQEVLIRDGHKCRWPGCRVSRYLEVHHIKRYADYPFFRFKVSNCISLCKIHHKKVTGKEEQYEIMFYKILLGDVISDIRIDENKLDE